jgi:hypothetical protein
MAHIAFVKPWKSRKKFIIKVQGKHHTTRYMLFIEGVFLFGGGEEYIVYEPHADLKKHNIDNQNWRV